MLVSVGLGQPMLYLTVVPLVGLLALALIRWEPIGKDVETTDSQEETTPTTRTESTTD